MLKTVIFWPAIAQVALILVGYVYLFCARLAAVGSGAVTSTDFAPGEEPAESAAGRRHLANQFELPMLFFVVIGFLFLIDGISILELALAWLFVAARLLHTIGSLKGPLTLRHSSFFAAFLLVVALWVDLAIRIL
ncbi:hypothetical protein C3941_12055 [Kaistia algarum]|uniref:MAPEG family protein n=1 Tax=Kaistia algarum TaxID=2083279 RepID=UPI000CE8FD77|nr:MAPEG family protein [Kaistia algarum]MCX5515081.1 MAPEG family protein [Kaistia algarum]PPE79812.1 hypothetical protein C3941_12055 [Kaistia algarum]